MISVSTFKQHTHKIFNLAEKDGIEFLVKHKPSRRVFNVNITITNTPYPKSQWRMAKRQKRKKGKVDMALTTCPVCNAPMVSGICTTKGCTQTHVIE